MKTVIEMAREAAIAVHNDARQSIEGELENLERFAALVREDEREACAKVCEDYDSFYGAGCAAAIRARGE